MLYLLARANICMYVHTLQYDTCVTGPALVGNWYHAKYDVLGVFRRERQATICDPILVLIIRKSTQHSLLRPRRT